MNKFEKVYRQIIKEYNSKKEAKQVIKEQNQNETIPEITEAQSIDETSFTFLNKFKKYIEQNYDDVLQIYIHDDTKKDESDEFDTAEETDFQQANIVVLTKMEDDYIVVQYQKTGSKIKKVYDSDDGLTAQQVGKYTDPKFVVDTVLKNVMTDIGSLNTWYKVQ